MNCARSREKSKRSRDHLIATTDVERAQREQNRVGSIGATDGVPRVRQQRNALLQIRDGLAEDEALLLHDSEHRGDDVFADAGVLSAQVEHRDSHVGADRRRGKLLAGNLQRSHS